MLDKQAGMGGPEKKKILVVEDEKDIRELVRYNLEQEGFGVIEAEEGELALALVQRERPALVILDIMLPGMSGLEICRAIRLGDESARLPILMLTAKAAADGRRPRAASAHADRARRRTSRADRHVARCRLQVQRCRARRLDSPSTCSFRTWLRCRRSWWWPTWSFATPSNQPRCRWPAPR